MSYGTGSPSHTGKAEYASGQSELDPEQEKERQAQLLERLDALGFSLARTRSYAINAR
jgi:hypothetical protein